jgi:hypothetical protein
VNLSSRCDKDNSLGRGDEALVIGYNAEQHTYGVEPLGAMLGHSNSDSHVNLEEAFEQLQATQDSSKKS